MGRRASATTRSSNSSLKNRPQCSCEGHMVGDIEAILETGSVAAIELAASALTERGETPDACANCAKRLIGPYCAVCGQPTKTRRRSVRLLVHDFVVDFI